MFFINDAWAAGEAAAPGGMEGFLIQVVPLIVIFAVFWFFLIRPQQKRQKEHMKMCDALAKGDEVMTLGGLNGRIDFVEDQTIGLQVASVDGKPVVVRMQRNAVQMVLPKGSIKF
ncbi:preprotein translocase subunit YajC [Sutterella massiliensis]|uniref:Sec translocon accessory complex subunit YajC n=1 Tax=Sutterella massiliensis TaxID=1816689 RepID=A0ABS2DQ59_9BURK|nr:preprotein translocase subunit YajC [Sutterella massiliensis]MBM6703257.1 preprotein translocase subunit YajC [Sutterella massiliensis]